MKQLNPFLLIIGLPFFSTNSFNGCWLIQQADRKTISPVVIWLTSHMYSKWTRHLIEPLPVILQWLRDIIVSVITTVIALTLFLSISTNTFVISKLIKQTTKGNNINPNMPRSNILILSKLLLGSFIF